MEPLPPFDIRCVAPGSLSSGAVAIFEEDVAPGAGPPRHTHRRQTEVFHVLEGRFRFEVDGEVSELETGGVAVVQAGQVHAFRNVSEGPARLRFELIPAGTMEEAFRRLSAGEVTDVPAFFEEFDMDLSGPPLD